MQDIPNPPPSTARDSSEPTGERRGIQSIEVGGSLLSALVRAGKPMMLKDLAREAGMPAAKAHPYLVSFGKLGLVEQDALTGRYGLGPFAPARSLPYAVLFQSATHRRNFPWALRGRCGGNCG